VYVKNNFSFAFFFLFRSVLFSSRPQMCFMKSSSSSSLKIARKHTQPVDGKIIYVFFFYKLLASTTSLTFYAFFTASFFSQRGNTTTLNFECIKIRSRNDFCLLHFFFFFFCLFTVQKEERKKLIFHLLTFRDREHFFHNTSSVCCFFTDSRVIDLHMHRT
jgi:hypothetical protein